MILKNIENQEIVFLKNKLKCVKNIVTKHFYYIIVI